jgi:hypothetical protein
VLVKSEAGDTAAAKIRAAQVASVGAMSPNEETCAAASTTRTFPEHAPASAAHARGVAPGMFPHVAQRLL